jgi:RNA polymerase sigma-70 factor (ECF subfamily)
VDSDRIDADEITAWAISARTGDPIAAAAFIRATQAEVWRLVAALVDRSVADDLTQETYLRAFRALPAFEARASARAWLLGIARHTCADHLRAITRSRRLIARIANAQPRASHDVADLSGRLVADDLLSRLAPAQREAFVLTQMLGLSYEETARLLEVPIGTVRSRVARARSELVDEVRRAFAV